MNGVVVSLSRSVLREAQLASIEIPNATWEAVIAVEQLVELIGRTTANDRLLGRLAYLAPEILTHIATQELESL